MPAEYRPLTLEDYEQAAHLESVAFYGKPTPERVEAMRKYFPPEWTVGAFVDGRLVADARVIPTARRINGESIGFGAVGPVACLAAYRRQGHVGKLMRISLERMRDAGQPLSGLHTPHDALYTRFGWERAEGKKRYEFRPKDVELRVKSSTGAIEQVGPESWRRLDDIYSAYAGPRNGPLVRVEPWWKEAVLRHWHESGERPPNEAFVWVSPAGRDDGYVVYHVSSMGLERARFHAWTLFVRDFVSLSGNAYLGLWRHLLAHDLARDISVAVAIDDPFASLVEDPWRVQATMAEGAMIRIVDLERAIALRPYCGERRASFTMLVRDATAPWNDGVWLVEAIEGRLRAERTTAAPGVEISVNTLAPLFTGFMRPDVAAGAGLLQVHREEAVQEMARAFAVTHPPFCNDYY